MHERTLREPLETFPGRLTRLVRKHASGLLLPSSRSSVYCLIVLPTQSLQAAANPSAASMRSTGPAGGTIPLAESLGVHFIPGSSSTVLIERDGKAYLVDLAQRTIQEQDSPSMPPAIRPSHLESAHSSPPEDPSGAKIFAGNCAACHGAEGKGVAAMKTPDFTNPAVQAALSGCFVTKTIREGKPGTAMPAWGGKLSEAEITAVAGFVKSLGQAKKPASGAPGGRNKTSGESLRACRRLPFQLAHGPQVGPPRLLLQFHPSLRLYPCFQWNRVAATRWSGSTTFPSPPLACDLALPINFPSAPTAPRA